MTVCTHGRHQHLGKPPEQVPPRPARASAEPNARASGPACVLGLWLLVIAAALASTGAQGQEAQEATEFETPEHQPSPADDCNADAGMCAGIGPADHSRPQSEQRDSGKSAADTTPVPGCPYCSRSAPEKRAELATLHWHYHWSRVGVAEYVTTGAMSAGLLGLIFVERPDKPFWRGPILLDSPIREAMVPDSRQGRTITGTLSDVFVYLALGQLLVVDNLIFTLAVHGSSDVAWQMAIINAQSLTLTVLLNQIAILAFRRERPYVQKCAEDPQYSVKCGSARRNLSFYSGHAATTAAAAGLICAHHTQLQLYASGVLDTATCMTSVGVSVAAGVLRLSSDNHWASDVAVGYLMGFLAGYLLPTLLYYQDFRLVPEERDLHREPETTGVFLMPLASTDAIGLSAVGEF